MGGGFFGGGGGKGAGKFLRGAGGTLAMFAGVTTVATGISDSQSEDPYTSKKGRNTVLGAIGGLITAGLITAAIVGTGGLAAIPISTGLMIGGGSLTAGGFLGAMATGEDPATNQNRQGQITSPSMQGPITSALNTRYLDNITDNASGPNTLFSATELNNLDKETPETKALALLLAENKRLNRQIQSIIHDGLKTKDMAPTRT